jgi:hypothetical protein
LIPRQAEKVIFFVAPLNFLAGVDRTPISRQQIPFILKFFTGDAVPALLLVQVDIAGVPDALEKFFDNVLVAPRSCADEAIVLDVELLPQRLKRRNH